MLGFAIAAEDVEDVIRRNAPLPPQPGYAPDGAGGVCDALLGHASLEPEFIELGYDVLNISHGQIMQAHLDVDLRAAKAYEGELNVDGLLPDFDTACRVAAVLSNNPALGTPRHFVAAQIVGYVP